MGMMQFLEMLFTWLPAPLSESLPQLRNNNNHMRKRLFMVKKIARLFIKLRVISPQITSMTSRKRAELEHGMKRGALAIWPILLCFLFNLHLGVHLFAGTWPRRAFSANPEVELPRTLTLRLLNALNSEDRGLKVRFSLATIAFETFELILCQMLSSQGKNAPSNPYPHCLVRLATSREPP